MDIHYTKEKIGLALYELALDSGKLRARVPEACAVLLDASYRNGFEEEFGRIDCITKRVVNGEWDDVSDAELKEIALIIWKLNEGIRS